MIEIPGYKILRQLGRGGMATVYLALQESVQREVALKVMAPTLLVDPDFGERFLREARIAAKLHHRNVVGVHDVGRSGDHHYIAMEYLGGGAVLSKDGSARPLAFALRATREIAGALHYAHAKGFVHRDVKPDNILMREDGSAALTDFGIARANDSATHMTRTGMVIGTPHYMSPEQARGRALDGRADLYSLGIVLYELLTGRVPYQADDSLSVGIMHITQPIPVLPERLQMVQPLLNRLLAKQPEDRFQDGSAVADAIEQLELDLANGTSADRARATPAPVSAPADDATRALTPAPIRTPPPGGMRQRAEPSLGRLDDVATAPSWRPVSARATPAPGRSRHWPLIAVVAAVLAIGGFALWHYQNRLRALLPSTELNDLIARGNKALADGKLVGNHNDSARELFQAARTLEPDNEEARAGLEKVGERLVERARAAMTRSDFTTAQSDLEQANEVLGGGSEIDDLRNALHAARTRNTASAAILADADAALAAGKLIGAGSAAEAYQRVLDADATNGLALNGLKKVGEALAQQARDAIAAGNPDRANQVVAQLAQLSPNHPAIPELRGALAKLHAGDEHALNETLARAEAQQRAGRIGGNDGALALFQSALKSDPGNERAKVGLGKLAHTLIAQANIALDDDNTVQAEKVLGQAEQADAGSAELRKARARLADVRERLDAAKREAVVTPAEMTRIRTMLGAADKALADGDLILPPGDCAFDKYRAVLAIDHDNAAAMAGLAKIPVRAKQLFEVALKQGTPNKARNYIAAISQSDPGDAAVPAMRIRLADVYLDQAQNFIVRKQRVDAGRALDAARELNPNNPRIVALRAQYESLP